MNYIETADNAAAQAAAASRELDMRLSGSDDPLHEMLIKYAANARYDARDAREDVALAELDGKTNDAVIHTIIACLNAACAKVFLALATNLEASPQEKKDGHEEHDHDHDD